VQRAPRRDLSNIKTGSSLGATEIQNLSMAYDRAANLVMRRDQGPSVNGGSGLREKFGYDGLYRMTSSTRYTTASGGGVAANDAYAYDDFGNLMVKGTSYSSYAYTVSRPHAVQSVATASGARTYGYDGNGNLQTVNGGASAYTGVTWWASNLARRVTKPNGHYTEFTYGPDRARYKQFVSRSASNDTTYYVGGLFERVSKVTGSATVLDFSHYVRAGDSVIAIVKRQKTSSNDTGLYARYPHRDHLGSIVAISDAGGALIERSGFDPWGKRVDFATWSPPVPGTFSAGASGGSPSTQPITSTTRGFTGHEQVEEFGFVHMNGRIYDPEIGKFFSADPTMQFPESTQGFNRYAYAGNNPLTFTDPSGFSLKSFLGKALSFVGMVMNFIPGMQGWAMFINAVAGFITAGSFKGMLMGMVTSAIGGQASGILGGALKGALGAAANFAAGVLVNTAMAMAQGAKFGAALLGSVRSALMSEMMRPMAEKTADTIRNASKAGTDQPGTPVASQEAGNKAANGGGTESSKDTISITIGKHIDEPGDVSGAVVKNNTSLGGKVKVDAAGNVSVEGARIAFEPGLMTEQQKLDYVDRIVKDWGRAGVRVSIQIMPDQIATSGVDILVDACNQDRCGSAPAGAELGGRRMHYSAAQYADSPSHEFGHVLGLNHQFSSQRLGNFGAPSSIMSYDIGNRQVLAGDVAKLRQCYGSGTC
jgi:RHS repeat-associated protein